MFNFAMYNLAGLVAKEETAGNRMLLRDVNDELVILCNDGNYYCNVRICVCCSFVVRSHHVYTLLHTITMCVI